MNKFISILFLLFFFFGAIQNTMTQTWDWTAQFGNEGNEIINGIEIEASGDYIIAGGFSETLELGSTTLEAIGAADVFISKLNSFGEVQWAVGGGSINIDETAGISIDAAGNIIWVGQYWVQGFFGIDTLFAQSNSKAIFMVKYDASGNYLWSKSISGSALKVINDVATDSNNNIYLTGYFEDSLLLEDTVLVAPLDQNFFIIKFDESGNLVWGHNYGTFGNIRGSSIAIDSNGDILVGGHFQGKVDFGGFVLQSNNIDFDLFVVKFDPSGIALWAREALGIYDNICSSIAIDSQSNVYVSGSFVGEMSLGDNIQISTPGFKENLFLLKYDADGSPVWARALDNQQFNDISLSLDVAVHDQMVGMTGYFEGELKIDELTIMAQSDQFNGFVAAFKTLDGKSDWLRLVPGSNQLISSQIAIDEEGIFIIGGYFLEEAHFDNDVLISNGFNDIFVSKMKEISTANREVDFNERHVEVFPNPAADVVNILSDTDVFFVAIYDIHGRLLIRIENEKKIDVSTLPSGTYFLKIGTAGLVKSILFIKQ